MKLGFSRLILPLAAVLAATLGYFAADAWRSRSDRPPTAVVVDFVLPDLDGRKRAASEWRGKVVLLNFWATWCPPCREEIPLFIDAQDQFAAQGLQVVGIAIDDAATVSAYAESVGMNYPALIAADEGLALMTKFGNSSGALPYSVILDTNGLVLSARKGAYQSEELRKVIAAALANTTRIAP